MAFGEIDPGVENKQVLMAYAENGQPLGDSGFARLVVPGDTHGGRYVSNAGWTSQWTWTMRRRCVSHGPTDSSSDNSVSASAAA